MPRVVVTDKLRSYDTAHRFGPDLEDMDRSYLNSWLPNLQRVVMVIDVAVLLKLDVGLPVQGPEMAGQGALRAILRAGCA